MVMKRRKNKGLKDLQAAQSEQKSEENQVEEGPDIKDAMAGEAPKKKAKKDAKKAKRPSGKDDALQGADSQKKRKRLRQLVELEGEIKVDRASEDIAGEEAEDKSTKSIEQPESSPAQEEAPQKRSKKGKQTNLAEGDHQSSLPPDSVDSTQQTLPSHDMDTGQVQDVQGKEEGAAAEKGAKATKDSEDGEDLECLKVCAANLPSWFDKSRVWRHFRRAGEVQHVWMLWDKWSGESQGIAFITFAEKASVKAALEYDGSSVSGHVIRVNLAIDKEKSQGEAAVARGSWDGGGGWGTSAVGKEVAKGKGQSKGKKLGQSPSAPLALGDKPEGSLGLMARGLSFEVTEADLKDLFAKCGSSGPSRVRLLVDKASGRSKGKAFIDFSDESSLREAVKLNETMLRGRKLRLEFSRAAE